MIEIKKKERGTLRGNTIYRNDKKRIKIERKGEYMRNRGGDVRFRS